VRDAAVRACLKEAVEAAAREVLHREQSQLVGALKLQIEVMFDGKSRCEFRGRLASLLTATDEKGGSLIITE